MEETAVLHRPLPRPSRRIVIGALIGMVVVAGLIGSRTTTSSPEIRGATATTAAGAPAGASAPPTTGIAPYGSPAMGMQGTAASTMGAGASAGGAGTTGGAVVESTAAVVGEATKIVKTGSIEVGVGKGTLQRTLDSVMTTAAGLGGYVSSTQTSGSTTGDDRASGALTVRVPAAQFEQMLSQVRGLGDVRSVTTAGQDVTAQFADIDARITALTATRDQLLTIMGSADAVQDVLSVQDRLTGVQAQLDSLIGQQKVLADQADLATLTVNVLEPGADLAIAPVDDTWTFGDAFAEARHRFADSLKDIIAGTGTVALGVLALAVAYAVYVIARRRRLPSEA